MKSRLLVPRVGRPEDMGAAVSFLLSDDASYISGVPAARRRRMARPMKGRLTTAELAESDIDTVLIAGIDLYGRLIGKRVPTRIFLANIDEGLQCAPVCTPGMPTSAWTN